MEEDSGEKKEDGPPPPDQTMLRLKNGRQIEEGLGRAWLGSLRSLQAQEPAMFQALLAIVQGRSEEVPPETIAALKDCFYLRSGSGALVEGISDVLLSAYQETPEGPVLANPFVFESQDQALEYGRRAAERLKWLQREVRREKGEGPSEGRQ